MPPLPARVEEFQARLDALRREVARLIVGHGKAIEHALYALVAGGHLLLEGVPGIGKTYLVRTLARAVGLSSARIQFTPDLMPPDIVGATVVVEDNAGRRAFEFRRGPLFAGVVLADEINRATPKTQSALLEAMQEGAVTVSGERHPLPVPFFVIATQNPIEMEGTYPLPEAQLDRFFFKLPMRAPPAGEIVDILERTTGAPLEEARPVVSRDQLVAMQALARDVPVAPHVADYVARLVRATHPDDPTAPEEVRRFVRYGASPRAAQVMVLAGKAAALASGQYNLSFQNVREVAPAALRHRVLLSFEGEAEGVEADRLVERVIAAVPEVGEKFRHA